MNSLKLEVEEQFPESWKLGFLNWLESGESEKLRNLGGIVSKLLEYLCLHLHSEI